MFFMVGDAQKIQNAGGLLWSGPGALGRFNWFWEQNLWNSFENHWFLKPLGFIGLGGKTFENNWFLFALGTISIEIL